MTTYPAESFYRSQIRQKIDPTTSTPIVLKVKKTPTLSSWLVTLSPDTINEEIAEYSSKDDVNGTITLSKRGINPSSQVLTTNWTDYNNPTYQKTHASNNSIRCDVTHLHIIQDYAAKLDKTWWLRDWMGAARKTVEIDSSWNEVTKAIVDWVSMSSTETIRKRKADGTYEEIAYSVLQADMASAWWWSYTVSPYENTIVAGDPVWVTQDGLFECTTENKSSINISASTVVMLWSVKLDATRTLFMYYSWLTAYARVGTLTGDTMAFGTEVTIGTWATWAIYWGCCEIWTNKVVTVWWDGTTASANNANHTVLTISGTTITVNTTYTYSMPNLWWAVKPIQTVFKVRNDCYWWGYFNTNQQNMFINSVSWTVITINSTPFISTTTSLANFNGVYLSDNLIWAPVWWNWAATSMNMYAITPWGVTIATTYTWTASNGTAATTTYLSRVSDTEYVATFLEVNTNTVKYTKPAAGTALTVTNIVANGALWYPLISLWEAIFWLVNWTTISVYTRTWQLIWTVTGITSPAANSLFKYLSISNARVVYITWTNWTVRIINFARAFYVWVANNSVWWVLFRWPITVSGVVVNNLYYLQPDWTIWETFSSKLIGKWIATNILLVW